MLSHHGIFQPHQLSQELIRRSTIPATLSVLNVLPGCSPQIRPNLGPREELQALIWRHHSPSPTSEQSRRPPLAFDRLPHMDGTFQVPIFGQQVIHCRVGRRAVLSRNPTLIRSRDGTDDCSRELHEPQFRRDSSHPWPTTSSRQFGQR